MRSIRPKAFISYRHLAPDQDLAKAVYDSLNHAQLKAFLDTGIPFGSSWEQQIDASLRDCTHFVVILSKDSIVSDMVRQEVRCAYQRMKLGHTLILPVWIGEPLELPYALGAWLNPLQYAIWRESDGLEGILGTLLSTIQRGSPLPFAGLNRGQEATQQALNRGAVAGAYEDLLLRSVAGELRPAMREIFHVVTASGQIPSALATGPEGYRDPPYVTRRLESRSLQEEFLAALHRRGRVLVRSRAGLGKTREIAELVSAMLRNGWTILVFDMSQTVLYLPRNIEIVPGTKTMLVFDGLHDAGGAPENPPTPEWLTRTIDLFGRKLSDGGFRVVASVRNEPYDLEKAGWDAGNPELAKFFTFDLTEFTETDLREILTWTAADLQVICDPDRASEMIDESDRTPRMMVNQVHAAKVVGVPLTAEAWHQLRKVEWEENLPRIFDQPGVVETVWSILLLNKVHSPASSNGVIDLAVRLGGTDCPTALKMLIECRLTGDVGGTVRLFGSTHAVRFLDERGRPVPLLATIWRVVAQTLSELEQKSLIPLAYACAREGALAEAIDIAGAPTETSRSPGEAYFARGLFRLVAGDRESGGQDLEKAVEAGWETAEVYKILGILRLGMGQPRAAMAALAKAIAIGPGDAPTQLAISLSASQLGDPSGAEQAATEAIRIADEFCACSLLVRGCLRMEAGNTAGAAKDFNQATPSDDLAGTIYLMRGVAERATNPEAAEASLTKAIDLGERHPVAFLERGAACARLGRMKEAEADFSVALNSLPGDPDTRFARGTARLALAEWAGAETDFTAAIDAGRSEAGLFAQRAAARAQMGGLEGAEEDFSRAISLSPAGTEQASFLSARAEVRWRLKRNSQAMDDLALAARLSRIHKPGFRNFLKDLKRLLGRP